MRQPALSIAPPTVPSFLGLPSVMGYATQQHTDHIFPREMRRRLTGNSEFFQKKLEYFYTPQVTPQVGPKPCDTITAWLEHIPNLCY